MKILNIFYSTFLNKCPRCHEGKVFEQNNPYRLSDMFKTNKTCSHCELKYEKEPNFFYGAMYVSYALTSGWFIVWFFIDLLYLHMETLNFALFITLSIIALSPLTIRLSRLMWLNFFNKFDKHYLKKEITNV
ncbi:MAG: DUF983 domain-containing protein [Bacteroidia bacterium]|nr:DUF983 domain-containing protein [Bacteroidia bacterium]